MPQQMIKKKCTMQKFTLEYWKDDDWYVGRLMETTCVFGQGETIEELEENIKDAYLLMMENKTERLPCTNGFRKIMEIREVFAKAPITASEAYEASKKELEEK
jgi:predicted RNase H-like HicB family nuclease